jgi:uncharacterized protein (TIGR00369 family)
MAQRANKAESTAEMSTQMHDNRAKIAMQFIAALPFCKALNIAIVKTGVAEAEMSMPYDEKIIGDPETGVVHGGAVSALLDTCAGLAVWLHPEGAKPTATIDLRIDYMRPARPGEPIRAIAKVYNTTRTVAFVRAVAHDGDPDDLVASATGAFVFGKKSEEPET